MALWSYNYVTRWIWTKWLRIREINPSGEQYRGGGAPNIVNHPNIFDVISPNEGEQEEYLSSYGEYEGSIDDMPLDVLASIPLVTKNQ